MKMFVNSKNSRMFAVRYIVESGKTASNDSGFFISDCNHIGYSTPVLMLNGSTALYECIATGKAMPFFYSFKFNKHFYSVMRYTDDNVLATNNSTCQNTYSSTRTAPIGFKPQIQQSQQITNIPPVKKLKNHTSFADVLAELESRFTIEKDCKNEAYDFILQMGLLDEFRKFCRATKGQNHFANCIATLTQM